jgi:pantoate--beta-alanine ligase
MKVVTTLPELRAALAALPNSIGFVPTMGYLHAGHLALVAQAKAENAAVVVSIFVNPLQFGPNEDLSRYPRDLERDQALLTDAQVDLLWLPTPAVLYPAGFQTYVTVKYVSLPLEGSRRPGHFDGVATVVTKLLNAVQPQRAYFGQKDAQQVVVLRRLVTDLNMPVEMVVCPIQRASDGLALSSRNVYLNTAERQAAPVLYLALQAAQQMAAAGETRAETLRTLVRQVIAAEPLAQLEYVSLADRETLDELDELVPGQAVLSLAARFSTTRLIDNVLL